MSFPRRIITLSREHYYPHSVIGILSISEQKLCNTLEPLYPNNSGKLLPVVPAGEYSLRYNVDGEMNVKYRQFMPYVHRGMIEIVDVPNHSYIYFHIGNYSNDTRGCILVGTAAPVAGKDFQVLKYSAQHYGLLYAFLAYGPSNLSNATLRIIDNPQTETIKEVANV